MTISLIHTDVDTIISTDTGIIAQRDALLFNSRLFLEEVSGIQNKVKVHVFQLKHILYTLLS